MSVFDRTMWALVAGVVILLVWALAVTDGFADDDPPQTDVRICGGTLPVTSLESNHDAPCYAYTVSATDPDHPGYLSHNSDDQFRHVYFRGGDPACIFTGDYHRATGHGVFHVTGQGGGRDCNASTPDGQCAYIAEGWAIFAISGRSCSQAGVPICQGAFCR